MKPITGLAAAEALLLNGIGTAKEMAADSPSVCSMQRVSMSIEINLQEINECLTRLAVELRGHLSQV